ncbi:MAG: DUF5996 family protein [Myxococcota bacterium]
MSTWPELDFARWKPTSDALHRWLQIVGKYRLANSPWVNHSWHATFYVTPHGLTTGPIHTPGGAVEWHFDFRTHVLRGISSDAANVELPLTQMSVAEFHERFVALTRTLNAEVAFHGAPNEVPDPIPFAKDTEARPYEAPEAARFHRALVQMDRVFRRFRTSYLGKVSPVHLFWGSFDLAVTRFTGRTAPLHPGGIPALPDDVAQEAYSHEVSSAGFWAGGNGVDEAMFYSYAYPAPEGFAKASVRPEAAYFDDNLGEFLLPYRAVREASDPDGALMAFLTSTWDAAAKSGDWPVEALECATGEARIVRAL